VLAAKGDWRLSNTVFRGSSFPEEICLVLRRFFVLFLLFAGVMAGGSMLLAQSPDRVPADGSKSAGLQGPISEETKPSAFDNEDQEFAMPFRWDIQPGMDDEFRYPSDNAYRSTATKSSPKDVPVIIPEPGSMVIMAVGLAALGVRRLRLSA
jgi:hypothetical protein